jgi:hypothetical protein
LDPFGHPWGCTAILLALLHHTRLGRLLPRDIPDGPRRLFFLASVMFFFFPAFAAVRAMVFAITRHIGPFHYVIMEGRHIHHLVFGILILIAAGYGWLAEIGTGSDGSSIFAGRLMLRLHGVGAALTLDDFASGSISKTCIRQEKGGPASTPWSGALPCWPSELGALR